MITVSVAPAALRALIATSMGSDSSIGSCFVPRFLADGCFAPAADLGATDGFYSPDVFPFSVGGVESPTKSIVDSLPLLVSFSAAGT